MTSKRPIFFWAREIVGENTFGFSPHGPICPSTLVGAVGPSTPSILLRTSPLGAVGPPFPLGIGDPPSPLGTGASGGDWVGGLWPPRRPAPAFRKSGKPPLSRGANSSIFLVAGGGGLNML